MPAAILRLEAVTREQYALPVRPSEPGLVEAGDENARNSPVEQPGAEPGRDGATISTPMSGPIVGL